MTKTIHICILAGLILAAGCAGSGGVSPYKEVDLERDLDKSALLRYQTEIKGVDHSQHGEHSVMTHGAGAL